MNRLLLLFFTSLTIWNAHAQLQIWEELDAANYEDTLFKGIKRDFPSFENNNSGIDWYIDNDTLYRATQTDTSKYGDFPVSDFSVDEFHGLSNGEVAFIVEKHYDEDNPLNEKTGYTYHLAHFNGSELQFYNQVDMGFDNNEPFYFRKYNSKLAHTTTDIYFVISRIGIIFSKKNQTFKVLDKEYNAYSNDSSYIFLQNPSSRSTILTIANSDTIIKQLESYTYAIERIEKDIYLIFTSDYLYKFSLNGLSLLKRLDIFKRGRIETDDTQMLGDNIYGFIALNGLMIYMPDTILTHTFKTNNDVPYYVYPFDEFQQYDAAYTSFGVMDESGTSFYIATYDFQHGLWVKEYDHYSYYNDEKWEYKVWMSKAAHHITNNGDTLTTIGNLFKSRRGLNETQALRLYINDSIVDYTSSHLEGITNLRITDDYLYVESASGLWRTSIDKLYYSGKLFYDLNQDGVLDENEPPYSTPIKILPSGITVYPSENGEFAFSGEYGETYTMTIPGDSLFDYTSLALPYTFNRLDSNYIGVTVANPELSVATEVNLARARCITTNESELLVKNTGYSTIDKITIALIANERTYVSSDEMTSRSGDTLFFEVSDLEAQENFNIPLSTSWPSVNEVGEQLKFETITTVFQNNDVYSTSIDSTFALLRCSFDPNDKAVSPAGVSDERYTLKTSELTYKIRFENTGNDVAYHVTIYDTLSQDLDWTTFEVVGSSHPQMTHIDDNGVVVFYFQDIMLPDSTTDKEGAQGYVTFKIKAKNDIEDYTVIENSAAIVFDSNKPIHTNTTSNTMVTSLPTITGVSENILSVPNDIVYNASTQTVSATNKAITQLQIYNLSGKLVLDKKASSIDVASLPSGVYIVYGLSRSGEIVSTAKVVL